MGERFSRLGGASFLLFNLWCREGLSQTHLGLESALVASTSTEGSIGSGTTSRKFVDNTTSFGFPLAASATLGAMLGEHVDLGARLGFVSETRKTGSESGAPEVTTKNLGVAPYLAYVGGEPAATTRFLFGLTAGLGTGTISSTSKDVDGNDSTSEATLTTLQYGALVGLRTFVLDQVSLDPSLLLMKSSTTASFEGTEEDISLSGLAFSLNLGLSFWIGRHPASAVPQAPGVASESPPIGEDSSEGVSAAPETSPVRFDGKTASIALALADGKWANLSTNVASPEQVTKLLLRDPEPGSNLQQCDTAILHAPNHEDVPVQVSVGKMSTPDGVVPVLKGELPLETLRALVDIPRASATTVPNHWIDVCGRHWYVPEGTRERLRQFIRRFQAMRVATPSDPAADEATLKPTGAEANPPGANTDAP